MFKRLHERKGVQLGLGLLIGIFFGFFLQKGGVTRYEVIIGQLLLKDFTVVKVMLSAVLTGMIGVYLLRSFGMAQLHAKAGSLGSTVIGGLIFGVGFGLMGYCPGTAAGAVGQGSLDALLGGVPGLLIGSGLFAAIYPKLESKILQKGYFGDVTLPELLNVNPWFVIPPVSIGIVALLIVIELSGL